MSKFVYNVKYIRGKAKKAALLKYIATREGVEKITMTDAASYTPATIKQLNKIDELIQMYPDSKELLEYEDFTTAATMKNASALISSILENNSENFFSPEEYIGYISKRPGVDEDQELGHGLFSNEPILNLAEETKKIVKESKTLYTTVLSLRREDAARLGFENSASWQKLIKKNLPKIAHNYKIPIKDLRWYAAFHNESHHPHCHMLIYSVSSAYVNKKSISNVKSALATDIFEDELLEIYNEQQRQIDIAAINAKSLLKDEAKLTSEAQEKISTSLKKLSDMLSGYKGKMVYGYLDKKSKEVVDDILLTLAEEPDVLTAYNNYLDAKDMQLLLYHSSSKLPPRKKITEDKKFKKLKNIIVKEVASLINQKNFLESDFASLELTEDVLRDSIFVEPPTAVDLGLAEPEIESAETADQVYTEIENQENPPPALTADISSHIAECDILTNNFATKISDEIFESEIQEKDIYPFASQELTEDDLRDSTFAEPPTAVDLGSAEPEIESAETADQVYTEIENQENPPPALTADISSHIAECDILINKFAAKISDENFDLAFFANKSAKSRYYLLKKEIYKEKDPLLRQIAVNKLLKIACEGNVFAVYDVASFLALGKLLKKDDTLSYNAYTKALTAFEGMLDEQPEYISYRIGKMYYYGLGTNKNTSKAINYLLQATDNKYAQFTLGRIYEQGDDAVPVDISEAVYYYRQSADNQMPYAAYHLARIYEQGKDVIRPDKSSADKYYKIAFNGFSKLAVDSPSEFVFYRLGCMALSGQGCDINPTLAEKYLKQAYEDFGYLPATYKLAMIYLDENHELYDIQKGLEYLTISALKDNNPYAAFKLGCIYYFGRGIEQNKELGEQYLRLASSQGLSYADDILNYKNYSASSINIFAAAILNYQPQNDYIHKSNDTPYIEDLLVRLKKGEKIINDNTRYMH